MVQGIQDQCNGSCWGKKPNMKSKSSTQEQKCSTHLKILGEFEDEWAKKRKESLVWFFEIHEDAFHIDWFWAEY